MRSLILVLVISLAVASVLSKKAGAGKGGKEGKGGDKCPPVDDIEEWAMEKYAGEICVFQELGWMDSDMNEMEEVIQADIDTLPTPIADALKGDDYEDCLNMVKEKMKSMDKKYKHCEDKYDEEEED